MVLSTSCSRMPPLLKPAKSMMTEVPLLTAPVLTGPVHSESVPDHDGER